jgi:hypothetical protein
MNILPLYFKTVAFKFTCADARNATNSSIWFAVLAPQAILPKTK